MPNYDYERKLFNYLNNVKNTINTRPLNLGGVAGGGGGVGGPPGGFIGRLPQSRIAFDTDEEEVWNVPPSGTSLVTNLDRIRYRIAELETQITVSATPPGSPSVNDLWVDIS